jgi:multidrug efflux pump subunit AcrA (membrane-fusion protein)
VQGFLQKINYKDGDQVKEGATLFVIEPQPYKLKLEQARAAEAGAQATLKQTEAEYERQAELASRQVASKQACVIAAPTAFARPLRVVWRRQGAPRTRSRRSPVTPA